MSQNTLSLGQPFYFPLFMTAFAAPGVGIACLDRPACQIKQS